MGQNKLQEIALFSYYNHFIPYAKNMLIGVHTQNYYLFEKCTCGR